MDNKKFKPLFDKLIWWIYIPLILLLGAATFIGAYSRVGLLIMIFTDVFSFYFIISPLFGYVELRPSGMFIKYGFFMRKEIPYNKIRAVEKERKFYSESMMSLKNAFEHLNIKYNLYDVTAVSVVGNDELKEELELRSSLSQ